MYLFITIDTEEDNWGDYGQTEYALESIGRLSYLQELFDKFDVKPTYLITYPVATDDKTISILKNILDKGGCEIGTHCHPWNTPPFSEERNKRNSRLYNIPKDVQLLKVEALHRAIIDNFGVTPSSFRAGRWAYSKDVALNLQKLGYKVDTSLAPYTRWAEDGLGKDFLNISNEPFIFSTDPDGAQPGENKLIEVPATVGFLQGNFAQCNTIYNMLEQKPFRYLRLIGLFHKLRLLNKVYISPELSTSKHMIELTKYLKRWDFEFVNMFFHSPTLKQGLTPFVKSRDDEKKFIKKIEDFLIYAKDAGIKSLKLSDAPGLFRNLKD